MSQLQVQVLAPFPVDDVVAKVELASGGHVFVDGSSGSSYISPAPTFSADLAGRDNVLGNGLGAEYASHEWNLPF
jgi:hypothetical protein